MNTIDNTIKYAITQLQVDEAVELLTTSLRHIPAFSMQLRADVRDAILVFRNLAKEPQVEASGNNTGEDSYPPLRSVAKRAIGSIGAYPQAFQINPPELEASHRPQLTLSN